MGYFTVIGILSALGLYCTGTWSPLLAGVLQNTQIQCSIEDMDFKDSDVFWIINNSVHGHLQVPIEFTLCTPNRSCEPHVLTIPVALIEMNGSTFQCVSIDYHNNTQYLGGVTVLEVTHLPQGQLSINITLQNVTARDILELSYPSLSIGPVNTTIGWTYSNLTCHPSVFTIQGYADRDDIPDNPSLNLTSTSSVLTFPTNITNGSLYWRLLAHDVAGTPCAQESALVYYYLDTNSAAPIPVPPSSDDVGCVPIPVGPRRDYSSLEVVWPERRDTVGRLCYCPPFEGEHHLFSRCISTTSCDTDYSITVSNDSVCFAELSPPLTNIPVYFTLLESCGNSRCVIRSVLASYYFDRSENDNEATPSENIQIVANGITSTAASVAYITTIVGITGGTTVTNDAPHDLLIIILPLVMGVLALVVFISVAVYYFYRGMTKGTYTLQHLQPTEESNLQTGNVYDIIRNENFAESSEEATEMQYVPVGINQLPLAREGDTNSALHDSVTIAQEVCTPPYANVDLLDSSSGADGPAVSNDYQVINEKDDSRQVVNGNGATPNADSVPVDQATPGQELAEVHHLYDVVTTREGIYNTLDHSKPQSQQESHEAYDALKHAFKARPVKSASSSDPTYDTVGKPEPAKPVEPPKATSYSLFDPSVSAKYIMVNKRNTQAGSLEGTDACSADRPEPASDDNAE